MSNDGRKIPSRQLTPGLHCYTGISGGAVGYLSYTVTQGSVVEQWANWATLLHRDQWWSGGLTGLHCYTGISGGAVG